MITAKMRQELMTEPLRYEADQIAGLTPIEAQLVLEHNVPSHQLESKLPGLVEAHERQRRAAADAAALEAAAMEEERRRRRLAEQQQQQTADSSSLPEAAAGATTTTTTTWHQVVRVLPPHRQSGEEEVVGMFLDRAEAEFALGVHENLAEKKKKRAADRKRDASSDGGSFEVRTIVKD